MSIVAARRTALLAGACVISTCGVARAAFTISQAPTQNVSCSANVCTDVTSDANLNVSDLESLLAGADTSVIDSYNGGLVVQAPISWFSPYQLNLKAATVTVDEPITLTGRGGLQASTSYGTPYTSNLTFRHGGYIRFRESKGSTLTINGHAYTLVRSVAELAQAVTDNSSGYFALATNYNAAHDGAYTDSPVQSMFNGIFEGLGNHISNLTIVASASHYVGLFSFIFSDGVIENLSLASEEVSNVTQIAGGLAGLVFGTLINDTSGGKISGTTGTVGGLVGSLSTSNYGLSRCSSNANLSAQKGVAGGLVGDAESGNISQSYATGKVRALTAGGLIGYLGSSLSDSYSTGAVVGQNSGTAGGLVGSVGKAQIATSYSTGTVSVTKRGYVGGLLGQYDAEPPPNGPTQLTSNYWDITTSMQPSGTGTGTPSGVTGLTTQQFQSGLPDGFNPDIWASDPDTNGGHPYLVSNPPR